MDSLSVIVWLTCLLCLTESRPSRPYYIDCIDSSECAKSQCCNIGMGRFTIPSCRETQDIGQMCRPNGVPVSLNVTYPDQNEVSLTNVYYSLCPCGFGLTCSETGICESLAVMEGFNELAYD